MICTKCVLPESKPDIWLNRDGVCNICLESEKTKQSKAAFLETDFVKILNKHKSRGEYDCLVMSSGGKDSTAALYYTKKRYRLNPLVFTFDNGFETEEAMENVRNAVEILGVDFLFFRSNFMKNIFAKILNAGSKAVLCHVCSIWYMDLAFKTAARYGIPIIVAGWTKGQYGKYPAASKGEYAHCQPEFESMTMATKEFVNKHLRGDPQYKEFPESMEEVLKKAQKRHKCIVLSPHWFLPYGADIYVKTIKKELRWQPAKSSYPAGSTNCSLNFLSVYNSIKYYGYTHYHVEMSKLIRQGLLTREEALKSLQADFSKETLSSVAEKLGYCLEREN